MLDIALLSSASDTGSALVLCASTDRTVTLFDIRAPSVSSSSVSFLHPTTPACLVSGPGTGYHFASGAYDGIVRVWDVRSARGAVTSFHAWSEGKTPKRVLGLDWKGEVVAVGGEGGLGIWRVSQGTWRKDGEEANSNGS
jgi:ribosome biogenesis protein YTM1